MNRYRKIIALLLIMLAAVTAVDVYQTFATPAVSTNTINEGGSGTQECAELVYKSGASFYARAGAPWSTTPGGNDVSGTDAETVMSTALQNIVNNGGGTFCIAPGSYTLNSQWSQDFNGKTVRMKMYGVTLVSSINDAVVFYDSCNGCATLRIEGGQLQPPGVTTNHAGIIIGEDPSYNLKPFGTGTSIVDFAVIRNGGGYSYPLVFRTSQGDFRMVNDQFYARGGNASSIACLMGGPGTFAYIENQICQTASGIGMELGNTWGYSIEGVPNNTPFSDAQVKIDASNSNVGLNFSFANRDFIWADIESSNNGMFFTKAQASTNTVYALITGISGSRIYGDLAQMNYIYDKGSLPYGKITNFVGPGNAFTPWGTSGTVVASTTYTISGSAVNNITITGGTGVVLSIKDGQTNCLVCGAAGITGLYLPDGSTVNFGAFSGAPTVKIYFSAG